MIVSGHLLGAEINADFLDLVLQSLLGLSVLGWLGWLRFAGFNRPSQWRSLHLLWVPALLALLYLLSLVVTPVASILAFLLAASYALLTALSEEGNFRGVILQALLPFGPLQGAALSGLFFGLIHLNNLWILGPNPIVLSQVVGAFFLGFGFAACRIRTNTIWPLILFHMLYNLPSEIGIFNAQGAVVVHLTLTPLTAAIAFIVPGLILACYGLFLLRSRPHSAGQMEIAG
ncbi:MAG TPA: CPBP family intramembrane glutamic endopeptidase [Ktedonobacteraceae bacterium]|nr:CPBP family intramembrane glutamic endopeptidase [Ktedonobacteraceae bacterium]